MTTKTPEVDFPITYHDNVAILQMPPRLTILEAVAFKEACHQLLNHPPLPTQLILDLSQTQFMDSSGVGALVHNYKSTQSLAIEMILTQVNPPVMAVLTMTGLDEVFTLQNDPAVSSTNPLEPPSESANGLTAPPETHPSVRSFVKRLIDIVGSLVGLAITGLLLIPIALAIRLDSKGPIFFGQTRCGWMGKRFKIIKFRSMCLDAEELKDQIPNQVEGAFFKNTNDPRITHVGKFLRRTSLDELPQFWNVLVGDMSLVGTRPPTPDEVERYDVPAWQRLDVRPGMTGEWQVYGRSQVRNFEDVIKLDLRYQENWSHLYDLNLILKTILILFRKNSGAF
jgi:anti-anti-sigma factor